MDVIPIRTESDHKAALKEVERLWDAAPGTPEADRLEVLFTTGGQVRVIRVIQGLGHGLDEQAVRAAQQIKFKPALHEGQPVDSTAVVHIIFQLVS